MLKFDIRARLYSVVALFVMGLAALSATLVYFQTQAVVERRHAELKELVETASSLISGQYALVKSGNLTDAEGRAAALKLVSVLRYQGDNYFWINDLHPTMVMHPIKPDLDGKDLSAFKDPNGFALFVEFAKVAKAQGSGFVDYMWPKPGSADPVQKTSYVALFEPWGWVLGSGVYNDDLVHDRNRALTAAGIVGAIVLLIVGGISGFFISDIVKRLAVLKVATLRLAEGHFDFQVPATNRNDEIGDIAKAFGLVVQNVGSSIGKIKVAAGEVTNASSEISTSATDLSQRTEEQAASLEQTAASMEQISATVKKNSENAQLASTSAINTRAVADRGGQVVAEAIEAMAKIERSSHKIADIIGVIDEIARQTNLLALNAAVEAARAGEAGRGFAVVASEVRSLAQRSSQAAKDINGLITTSNSQVKGGVELVNQAGATLAEIVESIKIVTDIVTGIASASAEQAIGLNEINKALSQMDGVTQQNSALVEEYAATAKALEDQAGSMDEQVAFFRIEEATVVVGAGSNAGVRSVQAHPLHARGHSSKRSTTAGSQGANPVARIQGRLAAGGHF